MPKDTYYGGKCMINVEMTYDIVVWTIKHRLFQVNDNHQPIKNTNGFYNAMSCQLCLFLVPSFMVAMLSIPNTCVYCNY